MAKCNGVYRVRAVLGLAIVGKEVSRVEPVSIVRLLSGNDRSRRTYTASIEFAYTGMIMISANEIHLSSNLIRTFSNKLNHTSERESMLGRVELRWVQRLGEPTLKRTFVIHTAINKPQDASLR